MKKILADMNLVKDNEAAVLVNGVRRNSIKKTIYYKYKSFLYAKADSPAFK